jgi:probable HAF family extracellular repeat protein
MQSKFASHLVIGAMSVMSLCGASWAGTPSYTVKEVHPEFAEVFPKAMNDRAKVGITFTNAKGKTADAVCGPKACTTVPVLPTAPKGEAARINGINRLGHVVGSSPTARVHSHAIVFDGVATREIGAFDEDGCGGCSLISWASDINDKGVVVGDSQTAGGGFQGFVWKDGVMTKLPTLGGDSSAAHAINLRGVVAGSAETGENGTHHAVVFRKGKVQDLGVLGTGMYATAYDINNSDVVVGESTLDGPNLVRPFIYREGAMTQLPLPAGALHGSAFSINDAGWVVGSFMTSEWRGRAWVYDGTSAYDLETLIPAADQAQWQIINAADINASGQILVSAHKVSDVTNKYHALILTPVAPTN